MSEQRPSEAVIEVSIPMRYFDGEQQDPDCAICAHAMCRDGRCSLTVTKLSCCDQPLCCGCFAKILKRCRCAADCTAVVGNCPFCRDMCRADAVSLFHARVSACRKCRPPSK